MISRTLRKLSNFIANLKLMRKLLLSYIILIFIPFALISAIFYRNFSGFATDRVTYSTKQSFEQAYSFLTYKLSNIKEASDELVRTDDIMNTIKSDINSNDDASQMNSMNKITSFLTSLQDGTNVARIRLYVPNQLLYSNDGINVFSMDSVRNTEWYKELSESGKSNYWSPSSALGPDDPNVNLTTNITLRNNEVLSLTKLLLNPGNYSEDIAAIRLDFYKNNIVKILNKANTFTNSLTYIQNSKSQIVATSSEELLQKYRVKGVPMDNIISQESHWTTENLHKEDSLVGYRFLEGTDWYMITVIPLGNIYSESNHMLKQLLIFSIFILAGAIFLAYKISMSITKGISELADKMRNLHNGKLEPITAIPRKDEIGMLIEDYNYMTERMLELIKEQYKSGQELKAAELKALQAQINPHFLYNTLDMINWFAYKNMNDEITDTVDSLATFYKLSLSNGKELITIKDELQQVSSYFSIQNMRFKNQINLNIDVPDEIKRYSILKLTLQPLVENSILHGILYREDKSGTITISASLDNDALILKVEDDGIGISEDKLQKIIEGKECSNHGGGFGVRNINERIKLYYGSSYGLNYISEYGKGTAVVIRIAAKSL